MRIIVWGMNYAPEIIGIGPHNTALGEYLVAQGHQVEMLTAFSHYPASQKQPQDRWKFYRTDPLNGVLIRRCWHYVPRRRNALCRILHDLTFVTTSFFRCLALKRPDVLLVVSPPLLLGPAAWLARILKRAPFVFHVQDLQPAPGPGTLKSWPRTRILSAIESFSYWTATRVSGISKGMLRAIFKRGVRKEKRVYFPNGIAIPGPDRFSDGHRFRTLHGFYRDDFIALYSGNLGLKQGLDILVESARFLENQLIKLILCGAGSELDRLQALVKQSALQNILFLPLQSEADYSEMLCAANLCLITQEKGSSHSFFPSKLLNPLAFGKPVLTVADKESELARMIEEGGFGENTLPGEPAAFVACLEALALAPARLAAYGEAGRQYVAQYEREKVLADFLLELEAVCKR